MSWGVGDIAPPVQLAGDFLQGVPSTAFGAVEPSYRPGVTLADLGGCLPEFVSASIRAALPLFGRPGWNPAAPPRSGSYAARRGSPPFPAYIPVGRERAMQEASCPPRWTACVVSSGFLRLGTHKFC